MLLSLLKAHGVRKVIASPGTMNIAIVGSMQHDNYFEMFSSVDERSAAYMACGMAAESGEPVAIVCTEATASRNYLPGLTEAYYRKLPVLAICGTHGEEFIGHLGAQVIDRSQSPNDTIIYSASIKPVTSKNIAWYNNVEINKALIKLRQRGGGPVLINIFADAYKPFNTDELPPCRVITHKTIEDVLPDPPIGRIAVFVGAHVQMSETLQNAIDAFCASNDSVVFCDNTSGYQGKYRFQSTLVHGQFGLNHNIDNPELLIHIGEVSGDTYTTSHLKPKQVWRVSPDGEVRDLFKRLSVVFEMTEQSFFEHYTSEAEANDSYFNECKIALQNAQKSIPEFGFGNIYVASVLTPILPQNSVIHFGIYNSLRTWNLFMLDHSIHSACNVGGFGIDGSCSTLIGAALCNPDKLYFLCIGDLAFFYDLNSLGNRHLPSNVRIILVNNGCGVEFQQKDHPGSRFGKDAGLYVAAAGHFGNKSSQLVKHYTEDLGFDYRSASSKEELDNVKEWFVDSTKSSSPKFLEVFVLYEDDVNTLDSLRHSLPDERSLVDKMKTAAKNELKKFVKKYI